MGPPKQRQFDRQLLVSLENLVPPDNFYRSLDAKLDLSFVRDWVTDLYAERGRPSIDPVVFFKLQLILFFEGLRSERLPEHSSLTRIRQRLGVPIFRRFFERVAELCQEAGLVWGKELFFDGTKVQANADVDSLTPRFAQAARDHVTDLFAADDCAAADDRPPELLAAISLADDPVTPIGGAIHPAAEQRLAVENQAQWKLLEHCRLDPTRPPSGPYRRMTDFRVSTTDPDAAPVNTSAGGKLGYHAFLDLLDRARFRFHLSVRCTVADSKYATGENLRGLAERGIVGYMPVVDYEQASPFFRHRDFIYDPETDSYRCPQGERLTYRGNNYTTRSGKYQAPVVVCMACPLRPQCTDSKRGRILSRPFDEDYRELARQRETTEAYKKALRKRQVWVLPLFGEAKDWHHLRRFWLRGLNNVNMQGLLVAAGQNLKRWLMATRRGHRPAGAPYAIPHRPTFSPR